MGKVYLVGAGPGAPDLLTLRAAEVLKRAQIVFFDALVHPDTLALATDAEHVPVGKRSGKHSTAQRFINKRLVDAARKYSAVVRLKGGDPMLFGRAQEEISALRDAEIEFEIVPGVTAALAASAHIGTSLTQRGKARSVVFLTPRAAEGERANTWARAAVESDSAVIYMGVGEAEGITKTLVDSGMSRMQPIVVVENASLPECRVFKLTLRELPRVAGFGITGPAVILVGEVYSDCVVQPAALKTRTRSA